MRSPRAGVERARGFVVGHCGGLEANGSEDWDLFRMVEINSSLKQKEEKFRKCVRDNIVERGNTL